MAPKDRGCDSWNGANDMAIKPTKRELHSRETRRRIIEAAEELFDTYGYDPVSVKDISEKAGVTTGAMYHHFKNKDDLIMAVFETHSNTFGKLTERFKESDDPLGDLEYFLCDYMVNRVVEEGMEFTRYRVLKYFHYTPKSDFDFCLEAIVQRGIELGCFREDASPEDLCDLFSSIHRGASYELCVSALEVDLEKTVRRRLNLALDGVRRR